MKEIIGNLLKKENVRQNLSSLRQEIKDENALAEALKLLAGEDELLVSFMGADDAKTRKNAALLIGDLHSHSFLMRFLKHTRLNRCAL